MKLHEKSKQYLTSEKSNYFDNKVLIVDGLIDGVKALMSEITVFLPSSNENS